MTPVQARMARAALCLPAGEVAQRLQVSRMALWRFEHGEGGIGQDTIDRLQGFYEARAVVFGPGHWTGTGPDVMQQTRLMVSGLWLILHEHGITPSSKDLIAAYQRALEMG